MKKCPTCKYVFNDSWKVCLKCSTVLVDESLVQGSPEQEKHFSASSRIIIIISAILVAVFFFFAIGGLVSQLFFAGPSQ